MCKEQWDGLVTRDFSLYILLSVFMMRARKEGVLSMGAYCIPGGVGKL